MRLSFLISLFALLMVVSCVSYDDVQFKELKKVEVRNSGSQNMVIDVAVDIENNARGFVIKEASIEAVKGDKVFGTLSLLDKVKVEKGANDNLIIPVRVNLSGGLLGAAAFVMNIDNIHYNVSVKVKSFIFSKTYSYRNLTADQVETILGIDVKNLIKR